MKKIALLLFSAFLLINCTDNRQANAEAVADMKKIEGFTLKDYDGKDHALADYKDSKAIVLIFVSTQCPVSNAYNERMAAIYDAYKDTGVTFLGINSNKAEDVTEIKEHSAENKLAFPILKDVNNVIADKLSASFTPEVYVVNGDMDLLYHGRIDDSRRESEVKTKDLAAALDEILAGKKVTVSTTKAFGCTIKRVN